MCTPSDLSTLGRRRFPCFMKWSLLPSDRVKLSFVGYFLRRQHSGKTVFLVIMLCVSQVFFLVCRRYIKVNKLANRALFANRCLVEYMFIVDNFNIISIRILGFTSLFVFFIDSGLNIV